MNTKDRNTTHQLRVCGETFEGDYETWINILSETYIIIMDEGRHPGVENLKQRFQYEWLYYVLDYLKSNDELMYSLPINLVEEVVAGERPEFEVDELKRVLHEDYKIYYPKKEILHRMIVDEGFLIRLKDGTYINDPYESTW